MINAKHVQAILYTLQARSVSLSSTNDGLPKTSYSSMPPPSSPAEIRTTLYKNVFNRYIEVQGLLEKLYPSSMTKIAKGEPDESTMEKIVAIAPLALEALLLMNCSSAMNISNQGPPVIDELSLNQIIDKTMALDPPLKTFSIFADMILAASFPTVSDCSQAQHPVPTLSISITVNLLARLVKALRSQPNYDAAQATKWIRCMIQVIIDRRGSPDSTEVVAQAKDPNDKRNLTTAAKLTDHALALARADYSYPAEELHWLASTLFNLAIDIYVSANHEPADNEACIETWTDSPNSKGGDGDKADDVTDPQFWARKAVEFARVLENVGGDDSALLSLLTERCQRLRWDVGRGV